MQLQFGVVQVVYRVQRCEIGLGFQLLPFYHSSYNYSQVQSHRGLSKTDGASHYFQLDGLSPCDSKGTQKALAAGE